MAVRLEFLTQDPRKWSWPGVAHAQRGAVVVRDVEGRARCGQPRKPRYFNHEKATATIPGKLRKLIGVAEQDGGISRSWHRPDHHMAGALGTLFWTRFGIDENTEDHKASKLFTALGRHADEDIDGGVQALATSLMRVALQGQSAYRVLDKFAEKIRQGESRENAVTR